MGGAGESMWLSVTSWLTPPVFFCILNLVIGTIYVISSSSKVKKHENHESSGTSAPPLFRAPSSSILLERVKSINFSFQYRRSSSDQAPDTLFPREDDGDVRRENRGVEEARELHSESHEHVTRRCQSETSASVPKTSATVADVVAKRKAMKKSASEKVMKLEKDTEEEDRETRRPETMREKTKTASDLVDDEAVDEKADDFINRFRQQLKLQRVESILQFKEMLNRGR